jgi:hypothetical protein
MRGQTHLLTPVILATQEAEIRKIMVQGKLGKKFLRTQFNQQKWDVVVCTYHPSYKGSINRIADQASHGINTRPY